MPIPDGIDIANALEDLTAGLRLDPEGFDDCCWLCDLHGPGGALICGVGLTAREAAADASVGSWELCQLLDCIMAKPRLPSRTAAGGSSSIPRAAGSACTALRLLAAAGSEIAGERHLLTLARNAQWSYVLPASSKSKQQTHRTSHQHPESMISTRQTPGAGTPSCDVRIDFNGGKSSVARARRCNVAKARRRYTPENG